MTQPPMDLQTPARVLSQVDAGDLQPQDRTALTRHVLQPVTRHLKRQRTSLHKKRTDKERQVTRFLQDLSPDEWRLLEKALQAAGTEDDPTKTLEVGRPMETTVVKESLNQQPKEFIFDTVQDHFEKCIRYDPYTSKLEEGWVHFRIPPFNNYITNPSSWKLSTKFNIRLWLQTADESTTDDCCKIQRKLPRPNRQKGAKSTITSRDVSSCWARIC